MQPTNTLLRMTHSPSGASDLAGVVEVPPVHASWQIQYTGEISTDPDVEIFNLDLFETPASVIDELHHAGVYVICYFSAGSYEDWRPDAGSFHADMLGKNLKGWPGERWLDVTRIDLLAPILEARLDLAVEKACDGVDPDNLDGYLNDTGFDMTAQDQLAFNIYLAETSHARGMAIGLKNDMEQARDLLPYFDWILNEECFSYGECQLLEPFVQAGKPVFVIEYELLPEAFCRQANEMGFNALHKNLELDAYFVDCRTINTAQEP